MAPPSVWSDRSVSISVTGLRHALPIDTVDKPGDAGARAAAIAGIPWSILVLGATLLAKREIVAALEVTLRENGVANHGTVSPETLYWFSVVVAPLVELFVFVVAGSIVAIALDWLDVLEMRVVLPVCLVVGLADAAITNLPVPVSVLYVGQTLSWLAFGWLLLALYDPTDRKQDTV